MVANNNLQWGYTLQSFNFATSCLHVEMSFYEIVKQYLCMYTLYSGKHFTQNMFNTRYWLARKDV